MREILFRGKSPVTGKWVYGDLFQHDDNQKFIMADNRNTEIIPDTLGEYTGLTDENGVKIFEGDILRYVPKYGAPIIGIVVFGDYRYPADKIAFHRGFNIKWTSEPSPRPELGYWAIKQLVEVIGNIHDNFELIKEGT